MNNKIKQQFKKTFLGLGIIGLGIAMMTNSDQRRAEARDLELVLDPVMQEVIPEEVIPEEVIPEDVKWENYFNENPITICIDSRFPETHKTLMLEAIQYLDEQATGLTFVIIEQGEERGFNHISIVFDEDYKFTAGTILAVAIKKSQKGPVFDAENGNITGYHLGGEIWIDPLIWVGHVNFFQGVFYHEMMHLLGFSHVDDNTDVMYYAARGRIIDQDNIDDINEKYHGAEPND